MLLDKWPKKTSIISWNNTKTSKLKNLKMKFAVTWLTFALLALMILSAQPFKNQSNWSNTVPQFKTRLICKPKALRTRSISEWSQEITLTPPSKLLWESELFHLMRRTLMVLHLQVRSSEKELVNTKRYGTRIIKNGRSNSRIRTVSTQLRVDLESLPEQLLKTSSFWFKESSRKVDSLVCLEIVFQTLQHLKWLKSVSVWDQDAQLQKRVPILSS